MGPPRHRRCGPPPQPTIFSPNPPPDSISIRESPSSSTTAAAPVAIACWPKPPKKRFLPVIDEEYNKTGEHCDEFFSRGSLERLRSSNASATTTGASMAFSFSSPSPFQQQGSSPFPGSVSPFPSFGQQQQQQQQFQLQQQPPQQQQQQQFQLMPAQQQVAGGQQQLLLFTADKAPASYGTKFEDLHPDSQKFLRQIEERIREYKDESERLDQCSRLYDASVTSNSFELDASRILQELGGISTVLEREKAPVQELMNTVNQMMWNTETAIRSYMMLRTRFLHSNAAPTSETPATQTTRALASSQMTQPFGSTVGQVYDFYNGLPKRPSMFMQQTVFRFEKYLAECCQWIEELEQLLRADNDRTSSNSASSLSESIPTVMNNVHSFFIYLAAKVEGLHQYIESMRTAYLADQRRRGDASDPFLEADRREVARQEAAARRIHPTLHLPPVRAQPSTQAAGLISSSPAQTSASTGITAPSSGGGFSLFGTASSSAPPASLSSSLFSTPSASTPSLNLFGSSVSTPQATAFGTAPTSSLFGSNNPAFPSTPAAGTSLFSTPTLGAGAATGSGASFGAASRSARPKSRTTRR